LAFTRGRRIALAHNPTVFVIDDDASIRVSLQGLLKSEALRSDVLSHCTAGVVFAHRS